MSFFRRHKIVTILAFLLLCLLVLLGWRMKGPYRSYYLDFVKTGAGAPGVLQVGVAARDITPDMSRLDEFIDADNDNAYRPKTGFLSWFKKYAGPDSYIDKNHNGKFDAAWMTGYNQDRPAKGVHDPLSARDCVSEQRPDDRHGDGRRDWHVSRQGARHPPPHRSKPQDRRRDRVVHAQP